MKIDAILLAGGRGKRMGNITRTIPKPLLNLNGLTLLERQLNNITKLKPNKIIIVLNYKKEIIKKFIENSAYNGKVEIVEHNNYRGIGEAILHCENHLDSNNIGIFLCDDLWELTEMEDMKNKFIKGKYNGCFHFRPTENYKENGIVISNNKINKYSNTSKNVLYYDGFIKKEFLFYLKKEKNYEMQIYYAMKKYHQEKGNIGVMCLKDFYNINTPSDAHLFMKNQGQITWNKLFLTKQDNLGIPQEEFFKFYHKYLEKNKNIKVLDLACGKGRHTLFLAKNKISTYATDISKEAIDNLNKKKIRKRIKFEARVESMDKICFQNNFFDCVVCLNAIHHGTKQDIENRIYEIKRVVKKEGIVFINLATNKNQCYRKGIRLEPNTYISTANVDAGEIHHFFSKNKSIELFNNHFRKLEFYFAKPNHWYFIGKK